MRWLSGSRMLGVGRRAARMLGAMTTEPLRTRLERLVETWETAPTTYANHGSVLSAAWKEAAEEVRTLLAEEEEIDVATILMNGVDSTVQPMFDTADGMRADLERRGWSPTAAEAMAASWLATGLAALW